MTARARFVMEAMGLGVLFAVGFSISRTYDVRLDVVSRTPSARDTTGYFPEYRPKAGPQIEMVYFGSSTCAWSNSDDLPESVDKAKRVLAAYAGDHGMSFKAVGVALDWSVDAGTRHLAKIGSFDEVSSGYNWGNSYALRDIWSDGGADAVTPQVIIYVRQFVVPSDTLAPEYSEAERRRVLVVAGAKAIIRWAMDGARLPPEFEMSLGLAVE